MTILDMGSGNGRGNDFSYIKDSIDVISSIDTRRDKVVLKYQLFRDAPPNIPLDHIAFKYAFEYGAMCGYDVTASVFDVRSLLFLESFDVIFTKIANRPDLYYFIDELPSRPLVVSFPSSFHISKAHNVVPLCCVSEYPATVQDYEIDFNIDDLDAGISDHTVGLDLYNKYKPKIFEKHFVLERSADNPDAGGFALDPKGLEELL